MCLICNIELNGASLMCQVIILARECGLNLELSDIPPESLVPEPLRVSILIPWRCSNSIAVLGSKWMAKFQVLILPDDSFCLFRQLHHLRNSCKSFLSLIKAGQRSYKLLRLLGR